MDTSVEGLRVIVTAGGAGIGRRIATRFHEHGARVFVCDVSEPALAEQKSVAWVSYPGLPSDRYHNLAKKYVPKGAGAVFTFGLKGGYDAGVKLVSNVKLFSHLANIGDTRSLIIHPASTTHRQLTDAQKVQAGAGPDVVRLSIGIEDKDDIIADLDQGLAAA